MGFFDKFKKQEAISEPELIVESWSPVCDIEAFVEKSDTCYYFYLWVHPISDKPTVKACWICNRKKAPKKLDTNTMGHGNAPMMPAEYVAHDLNGMELEADKLEIVWFAEGDAASLLYDGELICVIPGWADAEKRFFGYSKYAKGTGMYAWELTNAVDVLMQRTQKNKQVWAYFETDFWPVVQDANMNVLEQFFGAHEKYFAIDGGKFPPKALVTGNRDGKSYGITAGVSLIPMPQVELYVDEVQKHRRIELGMAVVEEHKGLIEHMGPIISVMASFPWNEITFFAHGHTLPYKNISGFEALLFINPKMVPGLEMPQYKEFMGDDINLLWVVPITAQEYTSTMNNGVESLLRNAKNLQTIHVFDGTPKFS